MTRTTLTCAATLYVPSAYELDLGLSLGGGATRIAIAPGSGQRRPKLRDIVAGLARMLELGDSLNGFLDTIDKKPWKDVFDIEAEPALTVEVAARPSVLLVVKLYDGDTYGVRFPGTKLPSWITVEPTFTVYDVLVGYDQAKGGLELRARVEFDPQESAPSQVEDGQGPPEGGGTAPGQDRPGTKTQLVGFPPPLPDQGTPNFEVAYLGLGQKFGPTVDVNAEDPLKDAFDALEGNLTSNDPVAVIRGIADYFHPDRGWFIAADIRVRGWRVRALFNDPVLYGLEVTCDKSGDPFEGLLFEILYQKLGPHLGVYYGDLTLPKAFRRIDLGAVALTLPSFRIWIYTNGDFRVSVGWPLGPNSIGVAVTVFTGGGGFYFAKLRSGDDPNKAATTVPATREQPYDPILEFGLAAWFGVGRSIDRGPFSATLSLTLQGTFQGLLAWEAPTGGRSASLSRAPDYHWFAATLGIVGQLQGSVDLKVVRISVLVRLSITAGIAFETGYGTVTDVVAQVDAEASLTIVFVRISVSFHTTISETFTLSTGEHGNASLNGPRNEAFKWMHGGSATRVQAPVPEPVPPRAYAMTAAIEAAGAEPSAGRAEPVDVGLDFLLHPSAVYEGGTGTASAVALLTIACPPQGASQRKETTDWDKLVSAYSCWLLDTWSRGRTWDEVRGALREGRNPPPEGWDVKLTEFLTTRVRFTVRGLDLTERRDQHDAAIFPVFDAMRLTWNGGANSVVFADHAPTRPGYVKDVDDYFDLLSLRGTVGPSAPEDEAPSEQNASVARFVFDDYFLLLARQIAHALRESTAEEPDSGPLAGMASRYLLHGLRLPDPTRLPSTFAPEAGYALTGQQFAAPNVDTCAATLSIGRPNDPLAAAVRFEDGADSTTATTPMAEAPSRPNPRWIGPDEGGDADTGADTIRVSRLPAAHGEDTRYVQRLRSPWHQARTTRSLVPLPPGVLTEAARRPLALAVTRVREDTPLELEPTLTIPLRLHRVERPRDTDLASPSTGAPAPVSPYLPFVYQVEGTDNRTRARVHALLEDPESAALLEQATVSLLYNAPSPGYQSDVLDPSRQPVTLTKTNLSTSGRPAEASTAFAALVLPHEEQDALGPTTAAPDQAAAFLRLIWEVSTVHTGGFFLRYAAADGSDLPTRIFESGDTADLTVAVTFAPQGATPFRSWHDSFVVALDPAYKDTLVLQPSDAAGPLGVLAPSHPPGCVGFVADWRRANDLLRHESTPEPHTPDWITSLYHLIQYQVSEQGEGSVPRFTESPWSSALSPVQGTSTDEQEAPSALDPSEKDYRQIVPVYRFAKGATTPYGAVGGRPRLSLRLNDVFGNKLDDVFSASFPVTYNDPLILPAEWPGSHCAYRFVPSGPEYASPALSLRLYFDPAHIRTGRAATMPVHGLAPDAEASTEQRVTQQVKAAVTRFDLVLAQLDDPDLTVSLHTTVQPSIGGSVGDPAVLRSELKKFALLARTELLRIADGQQGEPVELDIPMAIDPADLVNAAEDIVEIQTTLTFSRPPEHVYTENGKRVPGSATATLTVAADLDSPVSGSAPEREAGAGEGSRDDTRIRLFARDFESTFANFDGDHGRARVAVTSDVRGMTASRTDSATPALWAVRWSRSAGVTVTLDDGEPAYFSLVPLSVHLAGVTAPIPDYDGQLQPTYTDRTFTGVDMDEWARHFLHAVDEVLSADRATTVASLDAATYQEMMRAKSVLAQALAQGVRPVFEGVRTGDLIEARDRFEQSVLASLASAYDISAVVQVPMRVTASGAGDAPRARLFGSVVGSDTDGRAEGDGASAFTASTAKLPLSTTGSRPNHLSFLVSATEPHDVAHLPMRPTYHARFLEREIPGGHTDYGYAPSQWLRIVLEDDPEPLDVPLGSLDVPVPSREYPHPFVLRGQKASQSVLSDDVAHEDLSDQLKWDYEADLVLPEWEVQDDLWFDVTYNLPVTDSPGGPSTTSEDQASEPPPASLLAELASFSVAWPQIRPFLAGLGVPAGPGTPTPRQVVTAVWDVMRRVTRAWAALRGVPDPWAPAELTLAEDAPPPETPTPVKDSYVIRFTDTRDQQVLHVFARAQAKEDQACDQASLCWPMINGEVPRGTVSAVCRPAENSCADAPTQEPCWYRAEYRFATGTREELELRLRWPGLDVFSRQTAETTFWLVRNAHLSGNTAVRTSADFVYRTPEVRFVSPVSPIIVVDRAGPVEPAETVQNTLAKALSPLGVAGSAAYGERLLKTSLSYGYRLVGTTGQGLRAEHAVLLADHVRLAPNDRPTDEGMVTLDQLAERLARNFEVWREHARPSTAGATLSLAVILFADIHGSRLPIVTVRDLEVTASDAWWPRT